MIGEMIKEAREKRFLSQAELAYMLGFRASSLCKWEKNRAVPSVTNLRTLVGFLKLNKEEVFKEMQKTNRNKKTLDSQG